MMKYFISRDIAEFFKNKLEQQFHREFQETRFIVNKILNYRAWESLFLDSFSKKNID